MKITDMRDTISEIRRCVTKPKLKTPEESKVCFEEYLMEKHGVTGPDDPKCQELLEVFKKWPAMKGLLSYMGMD